MKRASILTGVLFCLCTLVPVAYTQDMGNQQPSEEFSTATVTAILSETADSEFDVNQIIQIVQMRMKSGPEEGKVFQMESTILDNREDMRLTVGETVVINKTVRSDGSALYLIKEKYRLPSLIWLTILFAGLTILFGRLTGFTSIIGLFVSVLILTLFIIPRIVAGDDPLFISVTGAAMIACSSIYLAHGFNKRTSVALLSTLVTLAISVILAVLFVYASKLFGMGTEETVFLQTGVLHAVNLRGLLLGGMIIGCLGVLDDITTAQCAAIDEISKANPRLTQTQLRKAGFSVGREHIASLINTLALAYVGASLPLLLLFKTQETYPLWVTLNGEVLAEEIIRTLVGSATLVFAVPVATYFAVRFLKASPSAKPVMAPVGHHH